MKIILRHAPDSSSAIFTAQGMENAGASVFSITFDGQKTEYRASELSSRFVVWGKYQDPVTPDLIDEAVQAEFDSFDRNK